MGTGGAKAAKKGKSKTKKSAKKEGRTPKGERTPSCEEVTSETSAAGSSSEGGDLENKRLKKQSGPDEASFGIRNDPAAEHELIRAALVERGLPEALVSDPKEKKQLRMLYLNWLASKKGAVGVEEGAAREGQAGAPGTAATAGGGGKGGEGGVAGGTETQGGSEVNSITLAAFLDMQALKVALLCAPPCPPEHDGDDFTKEARRRILRFRGKLTREERLDSHIRLLGENPKTIRRQQGVQERLFNFSNYSKCSLLNPKNTAARLVDFYKTHGDYELRKARLEQALKSVNGSDISVQDPRLQHRFFANNECPLSELCEDYMSGANDLDEEEVSARCWMSIKVLEREEDGWDCYRECGIDLEDYLKRQVLFENAPSWASAAAASLAVISENWEAGEYEWPSDQGRDEDDEHGSDSSYDSRRGRRFEQGSYFPDVYFPDVDA